jgi:hypothetical protein
MISPLEKLRRNTATEILSLALIRNFQISVKEGTVKNIRAKIDRFVT